MQVDNAAEAAGAEGKEPEAGASPQAGSADGGPTQGSTDSKTDGVAAASTLEAGGNVKVSAGQNGQSAGTNGQAATGLEDAPGGGVTDVEQPGEPTSPTVTSGTSSKHGKNDAPSQLQLPVGVVALAAVVVVVAVAAPSGFLGSPFGGGAAIGVPGAETVAEDVRVAVGQHIDTHTQSTTGGARDDYRQPLCVIVAATDERTCSDVGKLTRSWAWLAREELLDHTSVPLVEYNERIAVPKSAWQTAVVPRLDGTQSRSAVVQLHKLCDEKVAPQPTAVITVGACITGDGGAAAREEDGGAETETALAQSMWDELRRHGSTEEEFDAMFSRVAGRIIVVGEPGEEEGKNEDEEGIADDEVAERTRGLYAVANYIAGEP